MKGIDFQEVDVSGGFWEARQELNRRVTVPNVYRRFSETGRFRALKCVRDDAHKPHIFWDSDAAKWLESAAYLLAKRPDPELEKLADVLIADICASQREDGYYNCYFQVYEPENVLQRRTEHELYCLGHLIEAAVAYEAATKKDALLQMVERYADFVFRAFCVEHSAGFTTPGHEEIELALVKLYRRTGEEKYLRLAQYFIEERGRREEESYAFTYPVYHQSHLPVREQRDAEGHAVRALYLYAGMADVAAETGDESLAEACRRMFESVTCRRMYVTGGVGSTYHGEAFTYDYDLPNASSYAETCAGIALIFFAHRLALASNAAVYHDVIERALYNNVLAGVSLDGKAFFYVNPHEVRIADLDYNDSLKTKLNAPLAERVEVFDCSCCPPNLTRLIASLGGYILGRDAGALYVNQYIGCRYETGGVSFCMESAFPFAGNVNILLKTGEELTLYLRVPSWCERVSLKIDGKVCRTEVKEGYIAIRRGWCGERLEMEFPMRPRFVYANERVAHSAGRKAVAYGPLVLCAEGTDNGAGLSNLRLTVTEPYSVSSQGIFTVELESGERLTTGPELYSYRSPRAQPCTVRLIPYFCWANRGKNDMQVWFL